MASKAGQHAPGAVCESHRGNDVVWYGIAEAQQDLEVSLQLAKRSRRDGEMLEVFAARCSPVSFSDVGRYRNRRSAQLRRKTEALLGGKSSRYPIRLDDEIHGYLPDYEIAVAENRH